MKMILYTVKDANNTINKTKVKDAEYDINFKGASNITNPTVLIYTKDLITSNYAYIPDFKRYYFINQLIVQPKDIYRLEMDCDVLESFKDDILKCEGVTDRYGKGNPFVDDIGSVNEVRKEILRYESDKEFEPQTEIILSAFRRGDEHGI